MIKNSAPLTKLIYAKAANLKLPISGTFELTPVCNFACQMCYVRKTQKEVNEHQRPIMTAERWIGIARKAREKGMLFLLLTGGEPFLWPDFWNLYEELMKMGFLVSINTNGSLIDEQVIERLKKNPPKRLNITLYGASDETYEALCGAKHVFDKVDKAISGLIEAGIMVKLNCSLTPSNVKDMEAIIKYAKEKDLILEMTSYMFPPIRRERDCIGQNHRFTPKEYAGYQLESCRLQRGEESYQKMLYNIKEKAVPPPGLDESCWDPMEGKIRCRAGKAAFWITWDGYLTPCGMMPEPKIDMYEHSFSESWENLVKISEQVSLSGVCNTCPDHEICHSCAAIAMAETGKTDGIPTYLCKTVEELQRIAEMDSTDQIKIK